MILQRRLGPRLLKLLICTTVIWLIAAALYWTIPSPPLDELSVIKSLQNGQTVTRVFDSETFFPANDPSISVKRRRDSFIMQFKLTRNSTSGLRTLLFGGGHADGILDKIFAILDSSSSSTIKNPYYHLPLENFEEQVSPPIALDVAVGGKVDLVPPHVATADTALLYWWTGHETVTISFRMRTIPSENLVEIWPDSYSWYRHQGPPEGLKPLLSISLDDLDNPQSMSFVFPDSPDSSSPSTTYPIRLALFSFLLPVGAIGALLVGLTAAVVFCIYRLLSFMLNIFALGLVATAIYGLYWWIKHERPRISVSLTDIRNLLDSVLDDVRRRNETAVPVRNQPEVDLEAQEVDVQPSPQDTDSKDEK